MVYQLSGMDQLEIKKQFGDEITIHGGLDIRLLPNMSEEQVEEYVRKKMQDLKAGGGFIFNTSHTIQPDTPLEVVERAYKAAQQYGQY